MKIKIGQPASRIERNGKGGRWEDQNFQQLKRVQRLEEEEEEEEDDDDDDEVFGVEQRNAKYTGRPRSWTSWPLKMGPKRRQ